jgi:hypothetical protein
MIRVLLSYAHYPISVGRFFKLGLRRLPGVEVFDVGPCSWGVLPWQPQTDFSEQQDAPWMELFPDPAAPYVYPLKEVLTRMEFSPDVIVMVDAGFHLHGGYPHVPSILIATDPHCLDYFEQAQEVNAFFVMQKAYMGKYQIQQPGISIRPQWLPYCYCPETHYWTPDAEIDHDVTFVGVLYPERIELLEAMQAAGLSVRFEQGRLMRDGTAIYNRGRIAWNLSSRDDLPMRFWEGLAYRNLVVTNRVSDLKDLQVWGCIEGQHYVAYDRADPREMLDKLRYYCDPAHAGELDAIATAGWVWVQRHTYDLRARMALEGVGIRVGEG